MENQDYPDTLENEPETVFIENRIVRLTKDFRIKVSAFGVEYKFDISEYFETDGASIPNIFWGFPFFFTPFEGETLAAAVVHDFIYDTEILPKRVADRIFFNLLRRYKVNIVKAVLYYAAVTIGGKYDKHTSRR